MVIHANTLTEADKKRYEKIFEEYGDNMISYAEYLKITPVTRNVFGRVSEYLLAKAKFLLVRARSS